MTKKINFKKVAKISIPLAFVFLVIKDIIAYILPGNLFFSSVFSDFEIYNSMVFVSIFSQVVYFFVVFSVFVYIRQSLPENFKKLIFSFSLILFSINYLPSLLSSFSFLFWMERSAILMSLGTMSIGIVLKFAELTFVAFLIAFTYKKFYLSSKDGV